MLYIFLDRCAVIAIRDYLNGKPYSELMIDRLKCLDIEGNIVSLMPALIEGNKTFRGNIGECRKNTEEEIRKTSKFFENVELHPDLSNWEKIPKLDECEHEEGFEDKERFLRDVSLLLNKGVDKKTRKDCENKIIECALNNGLTLSSFHIIIVVLAVLYGSSEADNVCKFKKANPEKHIYNALNDILSLSRVISMAAQVHACYPGARHIFVTEDKALNALFGYLNTTNIRLVETENGTQAMCGLHISPKMFPHLTEEELESLLERSKANIPQE